MTACVYFVGWNIEQTIALTVRHYQGFCSHIVYLDNHSTDQSREIAASLGCEVRLFGTHGVLDDQAYVDIKNTVWKGTDYDWVIVCDDDEVLYHPDLRFILRQEMIFKTTIFKTKGFSIFSNDVPRETWLEIQTGVLDKNYDKLVIFNPKAVKDINYVYGCHVAKPTGNLNWGSVTLPLLHYRSIGGVERMIARHKEYEPRRQKSRINMKWGLGAQYGEDPETKRIWFDEHLKKSVLLSSVGLF